MSANEFILTDGERRHPLWLRLKAHFEEKMLEARGKNDGPLSEADTATLRGQIKCLKGLIALGDEMPPQDG